MDEVVWWYYNIDHAQVRITSTPEVDYFIHTDASNDGWGASDGQLPDINGRWAFRELHFHINVLELKAIELALKSYLPLNRHARHVRIKSDNTTAISYVNKQGGHPLHGFE